MKIENLRGAVRHAVLSILVIALVSMAVGCKGYGNSSGGGPSISSLTPASGPVGTSVTIQGANFGSTQGYSTVTFNGAAAFPTSWGATSIMAPVPAGATTGNVVVTAGGAASNGMAFAVTLAAPSITAQPASQTVTAGQTATFSVTAMGTAPLSYQWRKGRNGYHQRHFCQLHNSGDKGFR